MTRKEPLPRPPRLVHFTPLRYPGGKGKLASYVKRIIAQNQLLDGEYVEPFAGGSAIALELLFHQYVSRIHINDVSRPVYSFWRCVLDQTEGLCRLIRDTPLTVEAWDAQKAVFQRQKDASTLDLGFAMFFLNRTNRSGILNAGIIGGRDQTGPYKIDARYNANELIHRIESIAKLRSKITLTGMDAERFLRRGAQQWPANTLIYSDPPYYVKGRDLYYDFYVHDDHVNIATVMQTAIKHQRWIVSYDDVPEIRDLYSDRQRVSYGIGYSARRNHKGAEVMFFDDQLLVPELSGSITLLEQGELAL